MGDTTTMKLNTDNVQVAGSYKTPNANCEQKYKITKLNNCVDD
jgi:hypothetical protein